MFSLPGLKASQPKTVVFTVFWQDNMQKNRCFGTIFRIFSARARQVKNQSFFAAFLPPLIRTQEGVISPEIAKLHLNSTFCLSQSLPRSCNTKNYRRLSGASKCCKLRRFMNVPCILPAKKGTPPPVWWKNMVYFAVGLCTSSGSRSRSEDFRFFNLFNFFNYWPLPGPDLETSVFLIFLIFLIF